MVIRSLCVATEWMQEYLQGGFVIVQERDDGGWDLGGGRAGGEQ